MTESVCWTLTDGKAGTENQCLGLAEAVGLVTRARRVRSRAPWRWAPTAIWTLPWGGAPLRLYADRAEGTLGPPFPRLLIASGRASVGPALAIRRLSGGATLCVQIQDPRIDPRHFDLVAAPRHDRLSGANVMLTRGALHRVTPALLNRDKGRFEPRFANLPRPLVAVLIGGTSRHHRMTPAATRHLVGQLGDLCRTAGGGLLVTASRRTGEDNAQILRAALSELPCYFWDGSGENPYFGMLACADYVVVTEDSVAMTSEAASTGKPVFVAVLEGGSAKFDAFHRALRDEGVTRPLGGVLETWSYEPLDDTAAVAAEVRRRLAPQMADL